MDGNTVGLIAAPAIVVGALLLLCGLLLGAVVGRRYAIGRDKVSFDCALRRPTLGKSGGWTLGVARYAPDDLEWFRVFALSARPRRAFRRPFLEITDRRRPQSSELDSVLPGSLVVRCRYQDETVEFAMNERDYEGFATWLESAPPGATPLTR